MHSSVPLPWDGPMHSTFASGKRDGGGGIKLVSQMHFKVKQTLEKKTALSTVSRPREAEEAVR